MTPAADLRFRAMNTDFLVAGLPAVRAETVRGRVRLAAETFSRFLPGSEISRINQADGEWVRVSERTLDLLTAALAAFENTEGIFNPFLGREMQQVGYDRSFELLKPARRELAPTAGRKPAARSGRAGSFWDGPLPLTLDEPGSRVRLAAGLALDLGGIAKGWTAQQAAVEQIAAGIPAGLIDAGGDVVLWGKDPGQDGWGVGVAHPLDCEADVADLWLEGLVAMATSSVVKRRWQQAGQGVVHHILDPRTGRPADSDLLQATVLARDLTEAEVGAKCLVVLGSETGGAWLAGRRPDLAWLGVRRDGRVLYSDNLRLYAKEWEVQPYAKLA